VSLHTTRLRLVSGREEDLLGMLDNLEEGATLLADAAVDLILFHCTGVSTYDIEIEKTLPKRITDATGVPATATSRALIAAFRALDARRIVMVTPYPAAINARESAFLAAYQIRVLADVGLDVTDGRKMITIEPGEWYRLVRSQARPDADAYFISCTAVRSLEVIDALERDLGKPVVTSNQAAVWHSLRQMGINDTVTGFGRLMTLP
jgi:maleate isomerase